MATEVTMPQMGADMTEGTLVRWIKQVGDAVERGEIIAEIETDKATVELEAFESGVMRKHVVDEGETVPVGQVIALLGADGEEVPDVERKPAAETPARRSIEESQGEARGGAATGVAEAPPEEAAGRPASSPAAGAPEPGSPAQSPAPREVTGGNGRSADGAGEQRLRISPVARRIASEAGLDVRGLKGSGPDGRVLRRDVEAAIKSAPDGTQAVSTPASAAPARPAAVPTTESPSTYGATAAPPGPAPAATPKGLSRMRQSIARRMVLSKQNQPHYYLTLDVDMTEAMEFRKQLNAAATEQQRVSVNDLVVKACAIALERHPKFNAEFHEEGLKQHAQFNICIGIALEEGLIAPALVDVGRKSLGRIAQESKDLVERAKSGHLSQAEYTEGTFTITNLGAYGVETLIGIINPPQAAILGVGTVMAQPAVRDGEIVVRQLMKIALSADHRVSDGAEGARFIKEIQGLLENPVSLAL